MKQKGFSTILIILGISVLAAGIFLIFKGSNILPKSAQQFDHIASQVSGSACPEGAVFTKLPVDPEKILSVTPLGNLNPPDHTIPTDHIYLVLKNNNEIHPESATAVFAPSDITISRISHSSVKKSGKFFSDDYSLDFSPCKDVEAKFGHVTKLSPKLAELIQKGGRCDTQHPRPEDEYSSCQFETSVKISAGEEIGEAGGGTATGLDFWAIDYRAPELKFANMSRYRSHQLHTVCPVDLFDESSKKILSEKFGGYDKRRTIEPLCGRIDQDIAGTAQGNWTTTEGYIDMPDAWSKSLALVHDNMDPTIGVVSIGGIIASGQKIQFKPTSEGLVNRDFNQIEADGKTYCYEDQPIGQILGWRSGKVLIQLVNDKTLKAEYQQGNCNSNFNFSSPTIYER